MLGLASLCYTLCWFKYIKEKIYPLIDLHGYQTSYEKEKPRASLALDTLAEEPGSIPSTHLASQNHL